MEELKGNKREKKLVIILVIAILVILSLIGYIGYQQFDHKTIKTDSKGEEKNIKDNTDKEIQVTDNYIKRDISKKVNQILSLGRSDGGAEISHIDYDNNVNYEASQYENYSEEDKLYTALYINNSDFRVMNSEELAKIDSTNYPNMAVYGDQTNIQSVFKIYEASKINETYQELFGKGATHKEVKEKCPSYLYNPQENVYYSWNECGGIGYPGIIGYIYNYTTKNNVVYAYFAIGSIQYDMNENKTITYLDFKTSDNQVAVYNQTLTNNQINQDNYHDFTKYKMTFKKNNEGIYYFDQFEKVNH